MPIMNGFTFTVSSRSNHDLKRSLPIMITNCQFVEFLIILFQGTAKTIFESSVFLTKPYVFTLQSICLWTAKEEGLESYLVLSLSCLASAAFPQESQKLSNCSAGAEGTGCQCNR